VPQVLITLANMAVKSSGSVFEAAYRRIVLRLGHNKGIWATAHRLCRLTWKILHQGVNHIEYGMRLIAKAVQKRAGRTVENPLQPIESAAGRPGKPPQAEGRPPRFSIAIRCPQADVDKDRSPAREQACCT